MTVEERLDILETTVASLVKEMGKVKTSAQQTNTSIQQSIGRMSPSYNESQTAYIDDTEVIFGGVPGGELAVSISDPLVEYVARRDEDRVIVSFDPLKSVVTVTLSIK